MIPANDGRAFSCMEKGDKVTIDILFNQSSYFKSIMPVLWGMHTTAVIMAGSGMKEVLAGKFGSIDEMFKSEEIP